jgi:anaerobic magnesium-protoporphyrin IX monomethyl ester cyclase
MILCATKRILHLYKKAGVARFLMGMESYDEATLQKIRKGGTTMKDREAIQLMREHNMLSMATWVVGFDEETDRDYWRSLRQLLSYDPDQIQVVYVTPHRWTPYFRLAAERQVIQTDQKKWDYKHQVLATRHMAPWRVILWVKFIEIAVQMRPQAVWRFLTNPEKGIRDCTRWYYRVGRRVWFHEIANFLFRERPKHLKNGPTLAQFWGAPQDEEGDALLIPKRSLVAEQV